MLTFIDVPDSMKPLIKTMATGDDPAFDAQLVAKSQEPNILKYTPKDASARFGTLQMLEAWRAKGRSIYWLLAETDDLAGVVWYGKSSFPLALDLQDTPEETFAIRIYQGYSGHGLAVPFMKLSLKHYITTKQQNNEAVQPIWLQTDASNGAAVAVYRKLGYEELDTSDGKVTMILSVERILQLIDEDI